MWFRSYSSLLVLQLFWISTVYATFLTAPLSMSGLNGRVLFDQRSPNSPVTVTVEVGTSETRPEAETLNWAIHEVPVDYTLDKQCGSDKLGKKLFDLTEILGDLKLPGPSNFSTNQITLSGKGSIWRRSLRISGSRTLCATILEPPESHTRFMESRFTGSVSGSVFLQSVDTETRTVDTLIYTDLFHAGGSTLTSSNHNWKIYAADILQGDDKEYKTCDFLQLLYDPDNQDDTDCSRIQQGSCKVGDLTGKHGEVRVGSQSSRFSRKIFFDTNLLLGDLSRRSLYVVLFDKDHPDSLLACAKIRTSRSAEAMAVFGEVGVRGTMTFRQKSKFDPTFINMELTGLRHEAGGYHVHELPVPPRVLPSDDLCSETGGHFNPYHWTDRSPDPGFGTNDQYEVGDLSGKHGTLVLKDDFHQESVDTNLPLFGRNSIIGRSIVIHRSDGSRWLCGNLLPTRPSVTAVAIFTYPLVGRIYFSQYRDEPLSETTVHVESLVYSDGTKNFTSNHRWHVHVDVPGKDFYNWTARCISAGPHYNPYKVSLGESVYGDCVRGNQLRCEVGDLEHKVGLLSVSGTVASRRRTSAVYTDINLPLTGPHSIVGHSIVIHDDHAPQHRGDRMACTAIRRLYRQKAVVNKWLRNGSPGSVSGDVEFIQNTPYHSTQTSVKLAGLQEMAGGYHVHMTPVQPQLVFPCAGSAVYGHYNPYGVTQSPPTGEGSLDQYEVGDLSGKYGYLDGRREYNYLGNDTNMAVFGPNSVVGRCIVVHKEEDGARWACGTVAWGFSPSEAKEVHAVASFHQPRGYAWGYVRFSQVVYHDGSKSDTVIEVNLRHPGPNNKNVTRGHRWSLYINPVGQDATEKFYTARCVAGGYRWNPYLIHLASPNDKEFYNEQCDRHNPLRCEVGDMSGKLGLISLGDQSYVFSDSNLPMDGDYHSAAIDRSVVIHKENGGGERYACAKIEKEQHHLKWVRIRKSNFQISKMMSEIREVMGVPEWMVYMDQQTLKDDSTNCVVFAVHFQAPNAGKLEQDFNRLLTGATLDRPSLEIPGYVPSIKRKKTVPYRTCTFGGSGGGSHGGYYNGGSSLNGPVIGQLVLLFFTVIGYLVNRL